MRGADRGCCFVMRSMVAVGIRSDQAGFRRHVRDRVQAVISRQPCMWSKLQCGGQKWDALQPRQLHFPPRSKHSPFPAVLHAAILFPATDTHIAVTFASLLQTTRYHKNLFPSTPMRSEMGNAPLSNGDKQKYKMKPAQNLPLTEKCQHYTDKNDVPPEIQKYVFRPVISMCFFLLTPLPSDTGLNATPSSPPTTTVSL